MSGLELSGISLYGLSPDPSMQVMIAGVIVPGLARVNGISRGQKIDKKPQKGKGGIKVTFEGAEPLEATIEIEVWTEQQMQAMRDLVKIIEPADGKGKPQPFDVFHEFFFDRNVTQIIVEKIDGPSFGKKNGFYEWKLKVMEWKAEYATGGSVSPKAAAQGSNGPQTTLDVQRWTTADGGAGPTRPSGGEVPLPTSAGPPDP
jgi:hypothetical protein